MDDGEVLSLVRRRLSSESQLSLELNISRTHAGAKNASRGRVPPKNQSECGIGTPVIRHPKIGVIQYIEKLHTESQGAAFPSRYLGVLHHSEIGIEI